MRNISLSFHLWVADDHAFEDEKNSNPESRRPIERTVQRWPWVWKQLRVTSSKTKKIQVGKSGTLENVFDREMKSECIHHFREDWLWRTFSFGKWRVNVFKANEFSIGKWRVNVFKATEFSIRKWRVNVFKANEFSIGKWRVNVFKANEFSIRK